MENNQNIDQLFRDAFNALPNNAPSGDWDTPADSNWTSIEQQLSGTTEGGAKLTGSAMVKPILIFVLSVLISALVYFLTFKKDDQSKVPQSRQAPTTEPVQPTQSADPAEVPVEREEEPKPSVPKQAKPQATQKGTETSTPAYNNLERKRQETESKNDK